MDRLLVRAMEKRDLERVVEIESLSFSSPWSKEAFQKEIEENKLAVYLVAECSGAVAGYMGMWKVMDEGHITNIAVAPEYRGRGIGGALLAEMIAQSEQSGIVAMTLEVRTSNSSAQKLYMKYGFESAGIRPNYYENGEDANIMWKKLG
jgi:[ribosomal protein S18]-alanine N-acetyltransferase